MTIPAKRRQQPDLHPGFTDDDFDYLGDYIRELANTMNLYDWRLTLSYAVPSETEDGHYNSGAMIDIVYGKRVATIHLPRDFQDNEPDRQVQFLCHELSHCITDDMETLTWGLKDWMGDGPFRTWYIGFRLAYELTTDHIGEIVSKMAPPLDWPSQRPKRQPVRRR